jgi:hypothetical protein
LGVVLGQREARVLKLPIFSPFSTEKIETAVCFGQGTVIRLLADFFAFDYEKKPAARPFSPRGLFRFLVVSLQRFSHHVTSPGRYRVRPLPHGLTEGLPF